MIKIPYLNKIGHNWQMGRTTIFMLLNYTRKSLRMIFKKTNFNKIEINISNELSWPLHYYIKVYFIDKFRLPSILGYFLVQFLFIIKYEFIQFK